jgi:hypothetical protein
MSAVHRCHFADIEFVLNVLLDLDRNIIVLHQEPSICLSIVRTDATSGAAAASLPCIPPSSLIFRWTLTNFLPLHVAGERPVPFLAPWSDQGRALRPDQEPADSSCGSQLLPTIDGKLNAAPVCAAVCAAFVGLVGGCEMGIWEA